MNEELFAADEIRVGNGLEEPRLALETSLVVDRVRAGVLEPLQYALAPIEGQSVVDGPLTAAAEPSDDSKATELLAGLQSRSLSFSRTGALARAACRRPGALVTDEVVPDTIRNPPVNDIPLERIGWSAAEDDDIAASNALVRDRGAGAKIASEPNVKETKLSVDRRKGGAGLHSILSTVLGIDERSAALGEHLGGGGEIDRDTFQAKGLVRP